MAVKRSGNWASQIRADVPDMRAIESSVRNDFDELLAALVLGDQNSLVIRGFEINMPGSIGNSANSLTMAVADSAFMHGNSVTSGTFFVVRPGQASEILNSTVNPRVVGSFSPNSNNYVSLDISRAVDDTTSAPRAVWDPVNKIEVSKVLPLSETANYTIKITTSSFAANTLPVCIVATDSANNVISIQDRRPLFSRLGTAGTGAPNPAYIYPWTNQPQGRQENPSSSSNSNLSPFQGGDKMIKTLKEWMDAVMSSLREIKGTNYWYSINVGGSLPSLRQDAINSVITSKGNISHDLPKTTPGRLNWSDDIFVRIVGSRLAYKISANSATSHVTLTDGQVAYITLTRDQSITTPLIFTNGSPTIQSVGAVAWTLGLVAGDFIRPEGFDEAYYYKILTVDSLSQVTLTQNYGGASTGASGNSARYAWGVYSTNAAPSTGRHVFVANREAVPLGENMFWIAFRDDNGGTVPKIYTRFKAGELEQGESEDISDGTPQQVLDYIGTPSETATKPQYGFTTDAGFPSQITEDDNLTEAIGKLINNGNDIADFLDNPSYEESYEIVSGTPVGNQINPTLTGDLITIPVNSRLPASPQQYYVVGKGTLEVYLNGAFLVKDFANGWAELGTSGTNSSQIILNTPTVVGDLLTFRLDATGGPGAGGGGGGGGSAPDDDFVTLASSTSVASGDFMLIYDVAAAGYRKELRSNVEKGAKRASIIHAVSNVTVDDSMDVIIVDASSANVTVTLPPTSGGLDKKFDIKRIDNSANTVTIVASDASLLDNLASDSSLLQYDSWTLVKDTVMGKYWYI